ncbi:hypothetical protein C8F04DRAFT_1110264 [Mycena alexandri]|uniref:Secreted protein n=1 Tax=Mycena alexandri TaxID=1745969 RepID=A0AAD6X0M6_9AGAR|nr:hypothetical protein C8F04DRAFT_1110264 [Mycena alexandri]
MLPPSACCCWWRLVKLRQSISCLALGGMQCYCTTEIRMTPRSLTPQRHPIFQYESCPPICHGWFAAQSGKDTI